MTHFLLANIPASTPAWIVLLAFAALFLHITGGSLGIVSGFAAVTVRKGDRLHRLFGTVFLAAIVVMGSAALSLAVPLHQRENILGGVLAIYLVTTARMAVRRAEGTIGLFEKAAFAVAAGMSATMFLWGAQAAATPHPDAPAVLYFAFASFAALAATLDFRVLLRGGVSGVQRVSRHLWRMCFALFFASGSFFLGQQKVMPKFMHGSPILVALGVAPLVLMAFWLIRVRIGKRYGSSAVAA